MHHSEDKRDYKILIVDDKHELRMLLSRYIRKWFNAEILEAENGKKALEMIRKNRGIKLVLLDVMMPELDGVQTAKAIRQDYPDREFKICMITAKADETSVMELILEGIDDYVVKPVDEDILQQKLTCLMKQDFDVGNPPFSTINANIECIALNLQNRPLSIVKMSEYHVVVDTDISFEKGGILMISSEYLNQIVGHKFNFYIKLMASRKVTEKVYRSTGVFIALSEHIRKKLRTLTIRGEKVEDGQ